MTYAILARDPVSGQMGAAVQSHFFNVGPVVIWCEEGVGVIATMAVAEPAYGRTGLEMLRRGEAPEAALASLVARDPGQAFRQVGMLAAQGQPVAHTGASCIAAAGHYIQDDVVALGNLLTREGTWNAMAAAFASTSGDLASRLFAALRAAETHGGDLRGVQSAALKVVSSARGSERPVLIDLRVDDSPGPLDEMSRLLALNTFYTDLLVLLNTPGVFGGSYSAVEVERSDARRKLIAGQILLGSNKEPTFWLAVLAARAGETREARRFLEAAATVHPRWRELAARVATLGMITAADLEALTRDEREWKG